MLFHRLPLGIAGILAGCFGVTGAVVGMAEVCKGFITIQFLVLMYT